MATEDLNRIAFVEEAADLLVELEAALLELEESPGDADIVDRVFRAMHTIKGSGSMFGFDDIASFTHEVETVFDLVREGKLSVTREMLDLTLRSRDHIASLLRCAEKGEVPDTNQESQIIQGLRSLVPEGAVSAADGAFSGDPAQDLSDKGLITYRIRFRPARHIFRTGNNNIALLEELKEMSENGMFHHFCHLDELPALEDMDPESSYLWWDILLSTRAPETAVRDVFIFVEDDCSLEISIVDIEGAPDREHGYKRLGEILVERGDITVEELIETLSSRKRLGDLLKESGKVSREQVESALAEQKVVRRSREVRTPAAAPQLTAAQSSIRVAADKLDKLVDLVGELVIVQAQISQVVAENSNGGLLNLAEELEHLSDELRDATLGIRMLPIGTTFSKFRRLVRDLSVELGKEIELNTIGAETELDKTVIERLSDPLVHLLRNSIDHGIERPDVRAAAGKPRAGSIVLTAEHSGGEVLISIKDDGGGIDPDKVRAKAVDRGLITAEADLGVKDTLNLIFQPGFSTASEVTSVSGRGVGMDVVKRAIDSLRGNIEIDSVPGQGTTIIIKLPLTLAIIDGLQIQVGEEYYVLPLNVVEECVELVREAIRSTDEQIVNLRGDIVPYVRLKDWFRIPGDDLAIEQIVVVGTAGGRVGLVVDHVIGEHQTVIKTLGRIYRDVEGISGATIKGDGTLALILDVPRIIAGVCSTGTC